jgi:TPR repeat protein
VIPTKSSLRALFLIFLSAWAGLDTVQSAPHDASALSLNNLLTEISKAAAANDFQKADHFADLYIEKGDNKRIGIEISDIWTQKDPVVRKRYLIIAERLAAVYEMPPAINTAGMAYYLGFGVPKDFDKALIYFSHPSLRDLPRTMYFTADILLNPDYPRREEETGMTLLKKSADAGYPAAVARLKQIETQRQLVRELS